ncbi:helix-turn-helix domain containing protein [Salinibacillus xinjiangensis]|uniref:Helix-turn-helix domain containing protein n=1 Tax=Salinibacillus xinjiangensis TaxID=1229268 RepID=A0A6G1X7X7_9BACI|nr:helix-turn-helix domain containing protein [Salinibacillus xinjiangensis]MRG86980.1 helix-turn-helix domain containing protein [Salinibacillus xinjiangensis]
MTVYIAHEKRNFGWEPEELVKFRELWNAGASIFDIAKELKRPKMEIGLIILDQADEGMIKPRKGGLFGGA